MAKKIFIVSFVILISWLGTTPVSAQCYVPELSVGGVTYDSLNAGCNSVHRPGRYAKYVSFQLSAAANIQIDVSPQQASSTTDTYMYLLSGSATGTVLFEDDDDGEGNNSRVQALLQPGYYTVEATTYGVGEGLNEIFQVKIDYNEAPYIFIGSAYASGNNNTVEIYGLNNGQCTRGYATCRGNWWVDPCDWQSSCSTGWEWNPANYYTVPRQNCGWCGYDEW